MNVQDGGGNTMLTKLNDYFSLESQSDCVWYWGTFIVGATCYQPF